MAITDKVKNWISKEIQEGVYSVGSKMPTRVVLMEKYQIARASIDKVIRQLVDDGILSSSQGSGTYVVDQRKNDPHIYIILNTEIKCAEANSFHTKISRMISASPKNGIQHSIIGSHDFEKHFSAILQNTNSRVIWSRPPLKAQGYLNELKKSRTPQIILNRPIPAFDFISTDTLASIKSLFKHIDPSNENLRFGLIVPPLDLEESFLAERELYFQQIIHETDHTLSLMIRSKNKTSSEIMNATRLVFDKISMIDYLFIPDFAMVPYIIAVASERGVILGKELSLITIDWNEDQEGIVCIKQNWDKMFQEALKWAQSNKVNECKMLIEANIIKSS